MPDKIKAHYTTDEKFRPVGSNHLSKIRYDEESLTLFITFYNGACYKYLGVPMGLYEGLIASPSHGVYFWENIRQRFPYKLIDEPNSGKQKPTIVHSICPELVKLDKLDSDEEQLNKGLKARKISQDEYWQLLNVIQGKRDKLCIKLEKDGYFDDKELEECLGNYPAELKEVKQNKVKEILKALLITISACLKLTFKVIIIGFGVFFGLMGALLH